MDLEAGRLLARLTCGDLAHLSQLPEDLVFDLARNRAGIATRCRFQRILEEHGVRFVSPGIVQADDGRLAPTRKAVGKMTGRRLRRARGALGLDRLELARMAGVSTGTVDRLELSGEVRLTRSAYAIVGSLQLAGYTFGRGKQDRALVARRWVRAGPADRDLPIAWLGVGLGVRGDLELEAENVVPLRRRKGVTR